MTVVIANFPEATPGCSCLTCEEIREATKPKYKTKTGKMLSDADIWEFAAEGERGYDVEHLRKEIRSRLIEE